MDLILSTSERYSPPAPAGDNRPENAWRRDSGGPDGKKEADSLSCCRLRDGDGDQLRRRHCRHSSRRRRKEASKEVDEEEEEEDEEFGEDKQDEEDREIFVPRGGSLMIMVPTTTKAFLSSTIVVIVRFINQYTHFLCHYTTLALPTFCWKKIHILFTCSGITTTPKSQLDCVTFRA